jgi:hypothetical protein
MRYVGGTRERIPSASYRIITQALQPVTIVAMRILALGIARFLRCLLLGVVRGVYEINSHWKFPGLSHFQGFNRSQGPPTKR